MKVKENFVPTPYSDSTQILPPKLSIIYLQMLRPRPIPYGFIAPVLYSLPNN
jgi:hypothetical protein